MKNRKLDNFEKRKQDLKAKYDRDRKTIDDQIEREKEARRRERERKKAQREREKSLPPQPVKPSPDYDPAYNAFIPAVLLSKGVM